MLRDVASIASGNLLVSRGEDPIIGGKYLLLWKNALDGHFNFAG